MGRLIRCSIAEAAEHTESSIEINSCLRAIFMIMGAVAQMGRNHAMVQHIAETRERGLGPDLLACRP